MHEVSVDKTVDVMHNSLYLIFYSNLFYPLFERSMLLERWFFLKFYTKIYSIFLFLCEMEKTLWMMDNFILNSIHQTWNDIKKYIN